MIELLTLGTGNGFSKKYYNNNALFTLNGYRLLVDCGHTAHRSLYEFWNNTRNTC
jgi:ribonuclease BN (tRNA processing enzyme)